MTIETKKKIEKALVIFIGLNVIVFLALAYFDKLSTNPKDLVFIDFWGRLCVYSLWFVGYALYRKYVVQHTALKRIIIFLVCANIPFFLGLGYFNKLSTDAKALPFIDFWGRLTVYSLWFMAYEFYREFIQDNKKDQSSPAITN
jgi:surface polysaccharide O-acyltransferase-like enzyme